MSSIKEEQTVTQEVVVAWKCDVCGVQTAYKWQYEQEWLHFCEIHRGWGNDSMDSYAYHEVCSVDCFAKCLQDRLPDLLEYADSDAEIADMPVKFALKLLDRLLKVKESKEDA